MSRLLCGWLFSVGLSSLVFLLICTGVKESQFEVVLTETCLIPSVPMLLIAVPALLVFLSLAEFQQLPFFRTEMDFLLMEMVSNWSSSS